MTLFGDPSHIDTRQDVRALTFENPTGARGAGGSAAGGRKGAPSRVIEPGEKVVLADIDGPGRIRHIWMTFPLSPPEQMRAIWMELYYDGLTEPSISVPCLDFFGISQGRPSPYFSALTSVQEGRGFNAYFPMPFRKHLRVELTNSASKAISLYYQIDYTLEAYPVDTGCLHVSFRRENPTTLKRDFVIADGLRGPGRFLGTTVGIRVLKDDMVWYGEGEVKVYRDGDKALPTICGTGLEDYVGSAWGMNAHTAPYGGVPVHVAAPASPEFSLPDFVGFYRWHIPDPIVFHTDLKVTIQQIGAIGVFKGQEQMLEVYEKKYTLAGNGWIIGGPILEGTPAYAFAIAERVDDYCAAAFVYCAEPQAVSRLDIRSAVADIAHTDYELNAAPG